MSRSKEACVVVMDVGRSMGDIRGGRSGKSEKGSRLCGLDKAKKALRLMIQQKLLFTKSDEMGLVLLGTERTDNQLHTEAGGYDNVSVVRSLGIPDLDFLETIDSIECEDAEGDVLDALLVAMGMIKTHVGSRKYEKRIFVITDAAGDIQSDEDQTVIIQENMKAEELKLNVIGVDFEDEDEGENDDHDIRVKREDEEEEEESGGRRARVPRTSTQVKNEKFLREFAEGVNGAVFSVRSAVEMLSYFRSRSVMQVTKFRGPLQIGSDFTRLEVWSFGKTMMQNMPSLKKLSLVAKGSESAESMEVTMDRAYWNKRASKEGGDAGGGGAGGAGGEVEVKAEDRVKAYRYGKQKVAVGGDMDEEVLKYKCERSLKILGFTPAKSIPRHEYMGGVDCVVPEPGNVRAAKSFSALVHALFELDMVAAVRYVKRANAQPLFGILTPSIDPSMECLYFHQLPFEEDVRDYQFNPFSTNPNYVPSPAQLSATRNLINSMDLMGDRGGEEEPAEGLKPEFTFNPVLQRFYQCVERRALDESAGLAELDPVLQRYIEPSAPMLARAEPAFAEFKAQFTLTPVEKKGAKGAKRHWRDFGSMALPLDQDIHQAKLIKQEHGVSQSGKDDLRYDDIVANKVDKIGTVDPVKDFKAMIDRRCSGAEIESAIIQMIGVVKDLVKAAFNADTYPKAVDCLHALRQGCVIHEEADLFNNAMKDFKSLYHRKVPEFWKLFAEDKIIPIHHDEVGHSALSPAEARAFVSEDLAAPSTSPSVSAPSKDDDDLWHSMD